MVNLIVNYTITIIIFTNCFIFAITVYFLFPRCFYVYAFCIFTAPRTSLRPRRHGNRSGQWLHFLDDCSLPGYPVYLSFPAFFLISIIFFYPKSFLAHASSTGMYGCFFLVECALYSMIAC